MQNTTTQTQNFYTKQVMPAPAPSVNKSESIPPKGGKKVKTKQIIAVVGLVLFIVVAIMGVLIAQRQFAIREPVAPTAPTSQPEAAAFIPNQCVTLFYVPAPSALCESKTALTDFTANGGKVLPSGTGFNLGDEFVFSLLVKKQSAGTTKNVQLMDTLPDSLLFVSAASDAKYSITVNGQVVTATIPEIVSDAGVKVEFKVRVQGNPGSYTNSANIVSNTSKQTQVCSYNFVTLAGVTECVNKSMYDLQGKLIANGGALTRGQEYEYRVTAKATNRSIGEVKVHDIIPAELDYVRPAVGSEKFIVNDPTSGILTANFGILEDETATVGFIVKVPADIEPTTIDNIALVYSIPVGSKQPEPPGNADECKVSHTVLPVGTAECVSKQALTNFNGTVITSGSEVEPGQEFVYKITISSKQTTAGSIMFSDFLHNDLTFIEDPSNTSGITYNQTTREVSKNLGVMQTGQTEVVQFKVQLAANPTSETFNNVATVKIISPDDVLGHTCALELAVEKEYSCNSECTSNTECLDAGNNYICYNTGNGSFCRLESNPTNSSCQPLQTPTPPPTGPATPGPTPAPGCNEICTQNADCSNSAHVCVTTSDGSNRCRLDSYPESTTCTVPGTVAEQPTLPESLPESGPADWLNWLKAGLITLGIGTALFLLL